MYSVENNIRERQLFTEKLTATWNLGYTFKNLGINIEDPFDKNVTFDNNGQAMATPDNPYGLSFDPTYVFGPNQGFRMFLGFRYQIL